MSKSLEWRGQRRVAVRIGDLDLISLDGDSQSLEICQWAEDNSHRWTVAFIDHGKEFDELRFVGDRPFRCDRDKFWEMAELGYQLMSKLSV